MRKPYKTALTELHKGYNNALKIYNDAIAESDRAQTSAEKQKLKDSALSVFRDAVAILTTRYNDAINTAYNLEYKAIEKHWNVTAENANGININDYARIINLMNDRELTTELNNLKTAFNAVKLRALTAEVDNRHNAELTAELLHFKALELNEYNSLSSDNTAFNICGCTKSMPNPNNASYVNSMHNNAVKIGLIDTLED